MGIAMVLKVWVILPGIHEGGGYRAVLSLGIVRRFFRGLPEVTVCVFPGLLFFSLYGSFRWFLLGCPCVPYWTWSSPVGDGENTNKRVRELVRNSGAGGRHFCMGVWGSVNVGIQYLRVFGLLSVRMFIPWSLFFIGVYSGFVVSCAFT
jgi:hypothetical protein